jgi:hypothetical protein
VIYITAKSDRRHLGLTKNARTKECELQLHGCSMAGVLQQSR